MWFSSNFNVLVRTSEAFFSSSNRSFQNFLSALICFIGSAEWMRRWLDYTSEVRGQRRFRAVVRAHWPTPTTGSALHTAAQFTICDPTTLLCSSVLMFQEAVGKPDSWLNLLEDWRSRPACFQLVASIGTSSCSRSSYRLWTAAALLLHLPSSLLLLLCFIVSRTQFHSSWSLKPYKTKKRRSFTCRNFRSDDKQWNLMRATTLGQEEKLFVFLTGCWSI